MSKRKQTQIKKTTGTLTELGVSGLEQYSGYVREEFLRELQGTRGVKVYKEMRHNSAVINAMLFAIEMLCRQATWSIEPKDAKSSDDIAAAKFIEECRENLDHPWTEFIVEVLSMLTYGWALFEIVYVQRDDGRYGWKKFGLRAQETLSHWNFDDETGELLGMQQQAPPRFALTDIPIERCILFRTTSHKGNPEGRSMLRGCYRAWYFVKRIEEIEGIGVERDLAGLPEMAVPAKIMSPTASAEDKANFEYIKKLIRRVRRDEQEGIIVPSDVDEAGNRLYEFRLVSTGGTRQFDTNMIVNRYDQRILMTMIADFIMLGSGSRTGSFALSSDKTELFSTAIGAWLDMICETFNRYAIARLLSINGIEGQCELRHGDIETVDITKVGQFVNQLSASGAPMFPDDELENWLRKQAGMPERSVPSADMGISDVTDDELKALLNTVGERGNERDTEGEGGRGNERDAEGKRGNKMDVKREGGRGNERDAEGEGGKGSAQNIVEGEKLNGAQITAVVGLLEALQQERITEEAARELMLSVGVTEDAVQRIITSMKRLPKVDRDDDND